MDNLLSIKPLCDDDIDFVTQISRKDSLVKDDRVNIDNDNISGSISLKGAAIDDLTFKDYNTTLKK